MNPGATARGLLFQTMLASDLVLGIGNRWVNRQPGSIEGNTKGRKFVCVDIEPTQVGRVFRPDYSRQRATCRNSLQI
jgi:glyoxylate carboligase